MDDLQQRVPHQLGVTHRGKHLGLQRTRRLEGPVASFRARHVAAAPIGGVAGPFDKPGAFQSVHRARHGLCFDPRSVSEVRLVELASIEQVQGDEPRMGEVALLQRLLPGVLHESRRCREESTDRPGLDRVGCANGSGSRIRSRISSQINSQIGSGIGSGSGGGISSAAIQYWVCHRGPVR